MKYSFKNCKKRVTLLVVAVLLSNFVFIMATTAQTISYNFDNLNVGDTVSEFALTKTANANLFAKVSNEYSYSGSNSLWIFDNSNAAIAKTFTPITETSQLTLTFEIYPKSFAANGCYCVSLSADAAAIDSGTLMNHIYIFYDGSIKCYDGSKVVNVLPAGTVKPNQWNKIKITTDTAGNCYIYANNSDAGAVSRWNSATSYKSIYFSTYGGQELGDSFFLDDVTVNNIFDNTPLNKKSYNFDNLTVENTVSEFALTKTANANLFAKVSNKFSYSGVNSLWIYDNSNAAIAKTFTPITETKQLTLTFEIYPETFAFEGCYAVSLTGDTAAVEGGAIVNNIYIFYDGSIKSYNGTNVLTILPAGTIKPNQWNKLKITADIAGNCYVYANNSAAGTACLWKTASSYKSIYFSSYGGQELGDSFYLDDVTVNNIFDNTPNSEGNITILPSITGNCRTSESLTMKFNNSDSGNSLTYSLKGQPMNGTVVINGGSFTYTPNSGFEGVDVFSYSATDGQLISEGVVTVNVTSQFFVLGNRFKIDISNDGLERQFPFVYKFGETIFVSYTQHEDAIIASPVDAIFISRDNGKTWTEKVTNPDFYFTSMFEKDGIIYGISYFTYPLADKTTEAMVYWTTTDLGKTWVKHSGIVNSLDGKRFKSLQVWSSILFYRNFTVFEDGSIQGLMYGVFDGDQYYSTVWVKSTDNCQTWKIISTVAGGMPEGRFDRGEGFCEPTVTRVRDGSLLCVMRLDSYEPLYQCRSFDNGLTWTKPTPLPGLTREQGRSADPEIILMKNGILALSFGRPNDRIAFSSDGNGYKWDYYKEIYTGQTEGYTSIVETEPGRLLYVADQGRTGSVEKAIWGQFINVYINPTNYEDTKIKGAGQKIENISITGSTGLTSSTGPEAALDNDYTTPYIPQNTAAPFSLILDLGKKKAISSMVIRNQFTGIFKYKIETSIDKNSWVLYSDKTNDSNLVQDTLDIKNTSTRYIRLTVTQFEYISVPLENYISINEIEVFKPVSFNDYKITENRVSNVDDRTTVESFGKLISKVDNIMLTFTDVYGLTLSDEDYVGTGTIIEIKDNNTVLETYTIIIYGDLDGNGTIDNNDLTEIKNHLIDKYPLLGIFLDAADLYHENKVTLNSYVGIISHISGSDLINQNL